MPRPLALALTLSLSLSLSLTLTLTIPLGPNRFDLVPTDNPLERKWELQAATPSDMADWLDVLQQTRAAALARHGLTEGRSHEAPVLRN